MSLLERPNLLSLLILGAVTAVALGYGVLTYTRGPELEHYPVDPDYRFPFDFDIPRVAELPNILQEISGLTGWKENNQVLAVQDEDGIVFLLDAVTGRIERSFRFGKDRDYEGITSHHDTIYVLERDGDLHRFTYVAAQQAFDAEKLETAFSYRNDTEGLAYEPATNSLLIAPKARDLSASLGKYQRGIYRYHLEDGRTDPEPAYVLDLQAIGEVVYGKRQPYPLKPSGLAVDPLTGDIYVLASVGKILVVLSAAGDLQHIEILREKVFRQPEGICFDPAGNLYLSSEGRGGKGVVARLPRRTPTSATEKHHE